jgi:hypothetical protein
MNKQPKPKLLCFEKDELVEFIGGAIDTYTSRRRIFGKDTRAYVLRLTREIFDDAVKRGDANRAEKAQQALLEKLAASSKTVDD